MSWQDPGFWFNGQFLMSSWNRFKKAAMELKVGDPQDADTKMGPVVSEEHYKKVTSYLRDCKRRKCYINLRRKAA